MSLSEKVKEILSKHGGFTGHLSDREARQAIMKAVEEVVPIQHYFAPGRPCDCREEMLRRIKG